MWNEQNLWLDFENDEHQLKNYRTREAKNEESLMILKGIQQQGQNLWYYNQSHLQRIKILKNEIELNETYEKEIFNQIEKVIQPFKIMMTSKKLKVYFVKMQDQLFSIKQDWEMYQLILFNIMQNAVKYNRHQGEIFIRVDFEPVDSEQ